MTKGERVSPGAARHAAASETSRGAPAGPLVLFDGVCNLCHGAVRFVLEHERDGAVRFASLQSPIGRALLAAYGFAPGFTNSIVVVDDGRALTRSDAALRIARHLRSPWSWLTVLRWVPRPIRDGAYRLVAGSRYRVFGRREACAVPEPSLAARFLDAAPTRPARPSTELHLFAQSHPNGVSHAGRDGSG